MTIPQLKAEIEIAQDAIRPLAQKLESLRRELRDAESREFIRVNNIKKEDIKPSSGEGMPWFGHITQFVDYLRDKKSEKAWLEWNGMIYKIGPRYDWDETPALWEHAK